MHFEASTLGLIAEDKWFFRGFTEQNVLRICEADSRGSWLRMQSLPSYGPAMSHLDMSHEVFALLPVVVEEGAVRMTQTELRAMIEQNYAYDLPEGVILRGLQGVSRFETLYQP